MSANSVMSYLDSAFQMLKKCIRFGRETMESNLPPQKKDIHLLFRRSEATEESQGLCYKIIDGL